MTLALLILSIAANILLLTYALTYRTAFLELISDLAQEYDRTDHAMELVDAAHDMISPAVEGIRGEDGESAVAQGELPPGPAVYEQLKELQ